MAVGAVDRAASFAMSRRRFLRVTWPPLVLLVTLVACRGGAGDPVELQLHEMSGSGVSGIVTLTPIDATHTQVTISVDPAGHDDMPAHIHPGTCLELVPQPRYPLTNVGDGDSTTKVTASLAELLAGDLAVNLHASNTQMDVYTACVDLH
jgi:hypothetical protein